MNKEDEVQALLNSIKAMAEIIKIKDRQIDELIKVIKEVPPLDPEEIPTIRNFPRALK